MMTKLTALLVGVAMFGGAGLAQATEPAKPNDQLLALTDTQMDGVTASHLSAPPSSNKQHNGTYWSTLKTTEGPTLTIRKGKHRQCGKISCKAAGAITNGAVGGAFGLAGGVFGPILGAAAGAIGSQL